MDPADIRKFARRNRIEVETSRRRYWAEQHRAFGPARTVQVSQELFQYMRRLRPEWPTDRERAEDLAHHVALKQKIDRAARAFTAR